jgi:hypothetical protein
LEKSECKKKKKKSIPNEKPDKNGQNIGSHPIRVDLLRKGPNEEIEVKFARFSDHNPVIVEMSNYWHRS